METSNAEELNGCSNLSFLYLTDTPMRDLLPGTKVWLYACQSHRGHKIIEARIAAMTAFAEEKQWFVDRIFTDIMTSSAKDREPTSREYMFHLAEQEPRYADLIMVTDLSQLSRSQVEFQCYRARLRAKGWRLLSLHDEAPPGPLAQCI